MAIDPRIAMQYQGFQMPSQTNALAKFLQLDQGFQQNALAKMQAEGLAEQRRLMIQKAQEELAQAAQARAAREALPSPADLAAQRAGGGPTVAAAQAQNRVDPRVMALFQGIRSGVIPVEKYAEITDPNFGRPEVTSWQERAGANGRPEKVGMTKFGDLVGNALPQPVKMETMDLGGNVALRDPYAGNPGQQFAKTMTPSERDASARGWAGVNLQRENQSKPQWDATNGVFVDPRTRTVTKAVGPDGNPVVSGKPLPEAAQKQIIGARNLQDAVGNYLERLKGWGNMKMLSPDARAEMGNAYNNMMLQAKEAYNLGVLNGPDYTILQSVVKDPTKWDSAFVSNEALGNQASELARIAASIEKTSLEAHGKQYVPRQQPKPNVPQVDTSAGVPSVKPFGDPAMEAAYQAWKKGQQKK